MNPQEMEMAVLKIIGTINSSSHQVNSIWKLTVKRKILFNAKIKQNTMRN